MNKLLLYVDEDVTSSKEINSTSLKISEFIKKYTKDNNLKSIEILLVSSSGFKNVMESIEDESPNFDCRVVVNVLEISNSYEKIPYDEYLCDLSCFSDVVTVLKSEDVFKKEGYYGVYKRTLDNYDVFVHIKGKKTKQIIQKLDYYAEFKQKLVLIED